MASKPVISRYVGLLLTVVTMALLVAIGGFVFYEAIFSPVWHEKLPVLNTTGQRIMIIDYRNATDPTYERLVKFLRSDRTEYEDYVMPGHTCADFASGLHDDAEAQGIRCGIVSVVLNTSGYEDAWGNANNSLGPYFGDTTGRGHALVVFNTTDRGQVYVDCTGISAPEKAVGALPHDMIAYVSRGLELGELWVDQASDPIGYDFYEQQKGRLNAYSTRTASINAEIEAYDHDVEAFNDQCAQYEGNATEYAAEFDRYTTQLDDYNAQMSAHNRALESRMSVVTPAPSGGDALEQWRLRLLGRVSELDQESTDLQQQLAELDAHKDGLITRRNALLTDNASGLVIGRPLGIVESINVYW